MRRGCQEERKEVSGGLSEGNTVSVWTNKNSGFLIIQQILGRGVSLLSKGKDGDICCTRNKISKSLVAVELRQLEKVGSKATDLKKTRRSNSSYARVSIELPDMQKGTGMFGKDNGMSMI